MSAGVVEEEVVTLDRISFTSCFEWSLPEFTLHDIDHLTTGYIRDESTKHSLYVPADINRTCMKYYYDLNILHTIKTAKNGDGFKSNLFRIGPLAYFCDIFPNGYDAESKGNIDWFLNLSSIPPTIHKIAFKYEIEIKENGHKYSNSARLNHDELSVGWDEVKLTAIQDFNTLTLLLFITIYEILDNNDESVMDQHKHLFITKPLEQIKMRDELTKNASFYTPSYTEFLDSKEIKYSSLPSECGSWIIHHHKLIHHIRNTKNGEKYESRIFIANGFKWRFQIYPNGINMNDENKVDLGIYLVTMSPNISKLWIQYRILLHETGTFREDTVGFARRAMGYLFIFNSKFTFQELQKLQTLSFTAEITIFDVFDEKGNVITDYHNMHNLSLDHIKIAEYKWKPDASTVAKIKKCKPAAMFLSDFFQVHGFKWTIELYPHGQSPTDDDVNLYLTLLSLPPNLSSVSLNFELCLEEEANAKYGAFEQMGANCMSYGWPCNILKITDLMNFDQYTFKVTITMIDIYDDKGIAVRSNDNKDATNEKEEKMEIGKALNLEDWKSYTWSISDESFINDIHCAKNADYFPSHIFKLQGLKWAMQICPNGSSPARKGFFNWYLHLASLPTKINVMYIFYSILLEETGSSYEYRTMFQCRQPGKGWGNDKLKHEEILDLKKFTFKLKIFIIDVFDDDAKNITHQYKKYESPVIVNENYEIKDCFEWNIDEILMDKIKTVKNGVNFTSMIFILCGFEWFFTVYGSGKDKSDDGEFKLYINLESLPEKVSAISCHFQLFVQQTNTIYCDFGHFRKEFLFDGWQSSRIKTEEIKKFDKLTIKAMIKIIDVYDIDGMPITHKYANNIDMLQ